MSVHEIFVCAVLGCLIVLIVQGFSEVQGQLDRVEAHLGARPAAACERR